jgi:undecaprenyl-diphosphatase
MSRNTKLILGGALCLIIFIILAGVIKYRTPFYSTLIKFDVGISGILNNSTSLGVAKVMLFVTYLGNAEILIASYSVLIIILVILHEELIAAFFAAGLALGQTLSVTMKNLLARTRPDDAIITISHSGYAFPSGHALISMVFYGFIGYCLVHVMHKSWQKWLTGCIAGVVIFMIGFSRIYLGVHWASDVIGGWLAGGAILILLILIFKKIQERFHLQKLSVPHGASFVVIGLLLIALAFFICYFYVTQSSELRSTVITANTYY